MLLTRRWTLRRQPLGPSAVQVSILESGRALTFAQVIEGWRADEAFRSVFLAGLNEVPFSGFFWEMPAIRPGGLYAVFEHVVIGSVVFDRLRADAGAFGNKFEQEGGPIAAFDNLGGDATLVVPRPIAAKDGYAHLAAFLRSAPRDQQHALFERLAGEVMRRLARSSSDLWISTSGLGVPWLHVRLDSRPKYYSHQPYRRETTPK